jgi:hypothetical protein
MLVAPFRGHTYIETMQRNVQHTTLQKPSASCNRQNHRQKQNVTREQPHGSRFGLGATVCEEGP